jgi:hypothetical protein
VRVDFCEADVMDVFDEWRRAVGVGTIASGQGSGEPDEALRTRGSLPSHLERVIARLTALRTGTNLRLDAALDAAIRELDAARAGAKGLRGDARSALLDRLRALDASLLERARAGYDEAALRQLGADADAELAPFRARMPPDAYEQSRRAAIDRLIRERERLPVIALE